MVDRACGVQIQARNRENPGETHFDGRTDCHNLEDIDHLGAGLERLVRRFCADGFVETVLMVGLQFGEVQELI